jgi:hypothetical protein
MSWIVPGLLTLAGFAALALSQKKHHMAAFGTFPAPDRTWLLRAVGWLSLTLATAWCIRTFGIGYGLVVETAMLTAAGVIVTLTLTYRYVDLPKT